MNTNCAADCIPCADNPECQALVECGVGCDPSDQSCLLVCMNAHPNGLTEAVPLVGPGACVRESCDMECFGYELDCSLQLSDSACDECISANCLTECSSCAANPECIAVIQCAALCTNVGCVTGCGVSHPDGLTDALAYFGPGGCIDTQCPNPVCYLPF